MIEESFQKYIKDFILKSGEELEWGQPKNDNFLLEVRIIKRSERTYRILGLLILSTQTFKIIETTNDHKLDALKFTPRKKVTLADDDRQTFKWLEEGWVLKEVRLEKDYSVFDWGPVHALTNLSIANEDYQTKATTLRLVENRAILTRMAATDQEEAGSRNGITCFFLIYRYCKQLAYLISLGIKRMLKGGIHR
jgi:hypothetical protein